WLFLPQFASNCVLKTAHWILQRTAPHLVPHPKTAKYVLHQRVAYIFVIAMYLLYTMWTTEANLGSNYYQILGVSPSSFSASELKRNYRQLSLALHPDKNPGGEALFIQLKDAYKVLSDPVLQTVYDRAGAAAIKCDSCSSASDYLLAAIPRRLGIYLAYVIGSVALQVFRIGKYGTYWRYIAIGAFAALELMMVSSSTTPGLVKALQWLAPHRTGYEIAQILQQAMVCFFIALNQIGPQFIPQEK
ncbi:DnaJ-domain-containing protein, partial [Martensiomyces pterosporus]